MVSAHMCRARSAWVAVSGVCTLVLIFPSLVAKVRERQRDEDPRPVLCVFAAHDDLFFFCICRAAVNTCRVCVASLFRRYLHN